MKNNKFWLVWSDTKGCPLNPTYDTFARAKEQAKCLTEEHREYHKFYVLEPKCVFFVNELISETSFEATPEESLVVEPKFKVGDRVLLDNYYECVVDDYFDETGFYKLSIMGGGYNIANEVRVTKK